MLAGIIKSDYKGIYLNVSKQDAHFYLEMLYKCYFYCLTSCEIEEVGGEHSFKRRDEVLTVIS